MWLILARNKNTFLINSSGGLCNLIIAVHRSSILTTDLPDTLPIALIQNDAQNMRVSCTFDF